MIPGSATPDGTAAYARHRAALHYSELDKTGLMVSEAGFGCYRVDIRMPAHERALRKALLEGINLIDTSSNYADGGSEELVGAVLDNLISSGSISRESVVVVSKVGYLQGQNYELSQERKRQGRPFKDLVLYAEGLEHCIHPEFLEDQLTRSLKRLNLSSLDCYLLHNPEYYLSWARKTGLPATEAHMEYYARIRAALAHLEQEVERGRISLYGISSNTFTATSTDPEFTSLEEVWKIAESVTEEHHFRVVQLPMNVFETGGVTEANQSNGKSVIKIAREKKLGVLINRPLNAIREDNLVRLADVKPVQPASDEQVSQRIDELISSENLMRLRLLPELDLTPSAQTQISDLISVGSTLKQHWRDFGTYERWQELQSYYFLPRYRGAIQLLSQKGVLSEVLSSKIETHDEKLEAVFQGITSVYQSSAAKNSARIRAMLSSVNKDWAEAETLSQMAVRALRSTPGITSVLVGMRNASYVQDVLEELGRPVNRQTGSKAWQRLQRGIRGR
ncbi:MAG: aldo/keto reductase [Deltaproteobacteria bacterium]|nr:MAG: aldo/keto reductase [Deltaproteobacteria bacterium]